MYLREISCEDGSWMELVQDCVQWQALVLAVLKLLVLLADSRLVSWLLTWTLQKEAVRMGGGWNWFRIKSQCTELLPLLKLYILVK